MPSSITAPASCQTRTIEAIDRTLRGEAIEILDERSTATVAGGPAPAAA